MDNLHIYIKYTYLSIYIQKKNTQMYIYTHTPPFAQNKDHICS